MKDQMTKTITKLQQQKIKPQSGIVASCVVSESELQEVIQGFTYKDSTDANNEYTQEFLQVLFNLGMDTSEPVRVDHGITHRNRFGKIVTCSRWYGNERVDDAWLDGGYASRAAKDKASGSGILMDLYGSRGETEGMQRALEQRDKHTVVDESQWENKE